MFVDNQIENAWNKSSQVDLPTLFPSPTTFLFLKSKMIKIQEKCFVPKALDTQNFRYKIKGYNCKSAIIEKWIMKNQCSVQYNDDVLSNDLSKTMILLTIRCDSSLCTLQETIDLSIQSFKVLKPLVSIRLKHSFTL